MGGGTDAPSLLLTPCPCKGVLLKVSKWDNRIETGFKSPESLTDTAGSRGWMPPILYKYDENVRPWSLKLSSKLSHKSHVLQLLECHFLENHRCLYDLKNRIYLQLVCITCVLAVHLKKQKPYNKAPRSIYLQMLKGYSLHFTILYSQQLHKKASLDSRWTYNCG